MNDNSTWFASYPKPESPVDELVGLTIDGRYLIEKQLGHGGVGAVYLARDRKLHEKPIVVKVLLEKSAANEWVVQKFFQEKEALSRVDHPGVVGVLDTGELPNGKPYIVMQFIDGVSLREVIKQTPEGMDLERAASMIKQIGSALNAVHLKKIYHRDLKPENIMLQELGRGAEQVKIVDFGIAKIKESVVAPSTITGAATAGTIVYMSPEQLHGARVSAASDIYSFGVIAYEMVTGRRPFNPQTIANLVDMQREGVRVKPADLRPILTAEAQAIILRALALDPKDRYESAAEFGEQLAGALLSEEETVNPRKVPAEELPPTVISVAPTPLPPPSNHSVEKTPINPLGPAPINSPSSPDVPTVARRWKTWPVLIVVLLLIFVSLGVLGRGWIRRFRSEGVANSSSAKQRSLVYSLTVQKMRDGKPFQEPFQSSGQEIFESGYKFRLNVSSPDPGYLYVFNEGANDRRDVSFNIIYPTPATNNGSAKLEANQAMQTNWNTFGGQPGTEAFWMVWSASPITELEAARAAAFQNKEGALTNAPTIATVKDFLVKHSEPKPETLKETSRKQTSVRASGDVLVKLIELEHR